MCTCQLPWFGLKSSGSTCTKILFNWHQWINWAHMKPKGYTSLCRIKVYQRILSVRHKYQPKFSYRFNPFAEWSMGLGLWRQTFSVTCHSLGTQNIMWWKLKISTVIRTRFYYLCPLLKFQSMKSKIFNLYYVEIAVWPETLLHLD